MTDFDEIQLKVSAEGEPYEGGILLQATHTARILVCRICGDLDADGCDWLGLCHRAMDHVKEHGGHVVAVRKEDSAIYAGPSAD